MRVGSLLASRPVRVLGSCFLLAAIAAKCFTAFGGKEWWQSLRSTEPVTLGAAGRVDVGFSPEGSAIRLILKAIYSARKSIHVMAYVMTNPQIAGALAHAAQSGLAVYVEADYKENIAEDRRGIAQARLREIQRAGATVCTIDAFPVFHDKVMIIDGETVETGSFNYSVQGASRNSENAIVFWNNPELAEAYEHHFRDRIPMCSALR